MVISSNELSELIQKLSNLNLSAIDIELKAIKAFPNGIIYLEINDTKDQLAKLNSQIIQKIKEIGIPCNIRYPNYIPHITLFLTPSELTSENLKTIKVENEPFYLTSVVVSESITFKGNTRYQSLAELPKDILLNSRIMEADYFSPNTKKRFLTDEFDNNPVADYYRVINKLDEYDIIKRSESYDSEKLQSLLDESQYLYKKIIGFNNEKYHDYNNALKMYARGLIYQYYDRLSLLNTPNINKDSSLNIALTCHRQSYELGYIGALKNIGMIHYELGNYKEADQYLRLAINVGAGDSYTEKFYQQRKVDIEERIRLEKEQNSKCSVM